MRSYRSLSFFCCIFLFLLLCTSLAAEPVIENVSFQENEDASESVIFALSEAAMPKVFALKGEKPRVVFDFVGAGLGKNVSSLTATQGRMVEKIRVGRHADKTRVVLDLTGSVKVDFEQDFDPGTNVLTIRLSSDELSSMKEPSIADSSANDNEATSKDMEEVESFEKHDSPVVQKEDAVAEAPSQKDEDTSQEKSTGEDTGATSSTSAEENPLRPEALLSAITFEDTSNKGEMVLFKLNGFFPPEVTGQEKGTPKVSCVFAGTRIATDLEREQQPNGRFIKRISVEQEDQLAPVRVSLELAPNKNYDLQQVFFKEDNLFVVIVNSYDALEVTQ